jgi:hypothetical protein
VICFGYVFFTVLFILSELKLFFFGFIGCSQIKVEAFLGFFLPLFALNATAGAFLRIQNGKNKKNLGTKLQMALNIKFN